jgi:choline dehydrogenase-like flavoprotein
VCGQCNRCDGYPCPTFSKNDLPTILIPEAQKAGLDLQTNSVVGRLTFAGSRASGVSGIDRRTGQPFQIPAGLVVLSAGAVDSPAILLRSGLTHDVDHPWLGRGLTRHCFAAVTGLFASPPNPTDVLHKQVCISVRDDTSAAGPFRNIGIIQNVWSPPRELCRQVIPSPFKTMAAAMSGHLLTLVCIAQDEPNPENGVTLGPEIDRCGLEVAKVTHRFSPQDLDRRRVLIDMARRILQRAGALALHVYPVTTFTHAVGTMRFGSDPASSALDPDCRVCGVDNLFVVDGSFMPTSGSVNPSLTIAANALRAGRAIAATIRGL